MQVVEENKNYFVIKIVEATINELPLGQNLGIFVILDACNKLYKSDLSKMNKKVATWNQTFDNVIVKNLTLPIKFTVIMKQD